MEVLTQTMEVLVWTAELTRPQLCASALALLTALCVRHGTYTVLRVPLLLLVSGLITLDLLLYGAVRIAVKLVERVWVVGYKRRDQSMRRSTYAEWLEVGAALDKLEGLDQWKLEPESRAYNWRQVQTVTRRLRGAREAAQAAPPSRSREAICELESLLLPTLVKNYAGVGSAELYSKTHVGTKACVEAYVDEVRCPSPRAARSAPESAHPPLIPRARYLPPPLATRCAPRSRRCAPTPPRRRRPLPRRCPSGGRRRSALATRRCCSAAAR